MTTKKITPLDQKKHKDKRIRQSRVFAQAKNQQMIPLVAHEIPGAATEFPILFIKDSETGKFRLIALCGIKPNENLYADTETWEGIYVPAVLRNYPLSLAATNEDADKLLVCVDESSALFNDKEGQLLFNEKGEQTDFLKKQSDALMQFSENIQVTNIFIDFLVEKELLCSRSVDIDLSGENNVSLKGFYVIDQVRLNELGSNEFLDLRKRGLLPAIYAQLNSLHQIHRLSQKTTSAGSS